MLCYFFYFTAALADGKNVPESIALKAGSPAPAYFRCGIDSLPATRIQWFYETPGFKLRLLIHNGFRFNDTRYNASEGEPGRWDLYIKNIQLSDAGTYVCEKIGTTSFASAQLDVIGRDILNVLI